MYSTFSLKACIWALGQSAQTRSTESPDRVGPCALELAQSVRQVRLHWWRRTPKSVSLSWAHCLKSLFEPAHLFKSLSLSLQLERSINTSKLLSLTIIPSFPPSTIIPFCSRPSNFSLSPHPFPSQAVSSTSSTCGHVSQSLGSHVRAMPAPSTRECFATHRSYSVATTLSWLDCSEQVPRCSRLLTLYLLILYWFYNVS